MTGYSAVLADTSTDDDDRRWVGVARVLGPSWSRLPSLTVGLFGVQMLWSVEMSYASPYLLSLGLSKSLMAIVFVAGPLSGLIVQPLIGILADNSKSRFGRRRPFILVCAALSAFATMLLGFTRAFATLFTTLNSPSNNSLTIWLAVLSIYLLDFCINAVQALDRALLVDTIPTSQQPAGNAWAARMLAVGSVAGFFVGNLDLPHVLPFIGRGQLEVLSAVTALLLFTTQVWMCVHVKERVLISSSGVHKGLRQELKELWQTLVTLPNVIRQICWIQFFAWLGWFPVLFYTTVYIGSIHKNSVPIPKTHEALLALDTEATRLGTRAMFYSALVSLVANVIMPFFVVRPRGTRAANLLKLDRLMWALNLDGVRMHLTSWWALSHLLFAACMACTFLTNSVAGATWMISVTGFCWAMTQWAPFALLGEAILSHTETDDTIHLGDTRSRDDVEQYAQEREETRSLFVGDEWDGDEQGGDKGDVSRVGSVEVLGLGNARARISRVDVAPAAGPSTNKDTGLSAQAGAIIGIHNMFIVVPQFLVTGLSSVIFALFDSTKSTLPGNPLEGEIASRAEPGEEGGPDSIVFIFRLGGVAAVVAFILCCRLAKQLSNR